MGGDVFAQVQVAGAQMQSLRVGLSSLLAD